METRNFISCKIDGDGFGEADLVIVPYAEYDAAASPSSLKIITKTATTQLIIFIYGQNGDTGTYRFGEEVRDFYCHFAVITAYRGEMPIDYVKDSWFAFGKADWEGYSGGSVTFNRYDKLNHHIEGRFFTMKCRFHTMF